MFCFALLLVFIEYENNITLPVFLDFRLLSWALRCQFFFGFSLVILG